VFPAIQSKQNPVVHVNEVSVNEGSVRAGKGSTLNHLSKSARNDSRSVRFSFVMNIIPRDDVVSARSRRHAHCEDESGIKSYLQQPTDLLAFSITWQVSRTTCASEQLTWTRMILLQVR